MMRKLYILCIIQLAVTKIVLIRALPHIRYDQFSHSLTSSNDKLEKDLRPSSNPKLEFNPNVQYAPKFKIKTRLEFLHIAKNAGSSIVHSAAKVGINWGACHFIFCEHNEPDFADPPISIWHRPLSELPSNLYGDDAALFVVIRNPYERCISKYYYNNQKHTDISVLNQKDHLNDWIKSTLKFKLDMDRFVPFFYPGYNYVFDKYTGEQVVDYVLRYETLEHDFDELMKDFSLNISLDHVNARHTRKVMGVENLSTESIQIINDYFYNDFIAFGYEMIV